MVSETLQKIKNNGLGNATSSSIYIDGMSDGIMYKAFLIHFLPVFKLKNGPIFQYIAVFDIICLQATLFRFVVMVLGLI